MSSRGAMTESGKTRVTTKTRNQKACDVCRSRRIKCQPRADGSDSAPTCEGCRELGVPCTSERPRKKRGPPNAHALPQLEPEPHLARPPEVVRHHHHEPQAVEDPTLSALDLLGPSHLIQTILTDWFEHIHPIAPILHRRRFIQRLQSGEADTNPVFCALVISTVAATCSTLRRKCHAEYGGITTLRCVEVIESRALLPLNGPYSLDWCATKYNLGAACLSWNGAPALEPAQVYRYTTDAQFGVRHLLQYRNEELGSVERELLKRLFWLLVVGDISMDLMGRPTLGFVNIHDHTDRSNRPLPLADTQLDSDATLSQGLSVLSPVSISSPAALAHASPGGPATDPITTWHGDKISYVPALNHLSDIFLAWYRAQLDRLYLSSEHALDNGLRRIQTTLDRLPPELRWRGGLSRPRGATLGHDAQIANLFITSLYIRSNLLQLFNSSSRDEHQRLVSDLLEILHHLPRATLEANGFSLIPKIRDIGGAYLSELSDERRGAFTTNNERSEGEGVVLIDEDAKRRLQELLSELEILDFVPGSLF